MSEPQRAGRSADRRGCVARDREPALDFRSEIRWPGEVAIGTRVARVGRSSVTLHQGLFQCDVCVATAETVIVQMDEATRRSRPLTAEAVKRLTVLAGSPPLEQGGSSKQLS